MIATAPTISLESQQLTPAQLRWIMNVGDSTVHEWLDGTTPALSHFRRSRLIRISSEAALEFIFRNTVRARGAGEPLLVPQGQPLMFPEEAWQRIERLIAEQVEAKIRRAA